MPGLVGGSWLSVGQLKAAAASSSANIGSLPDSGGTDLDRTNASAPTVPQSRTVSDCKLLYATCNGDCG